jgi:hypothetical protein
MSRDAPHVATVEQRGDNTLRVYVQTESFQPGQEVEVSVYLTQGSAYATHNEKKRIPFPDLNNSKQPAVLYVELPATDLDATQNVTVVARVAEAWPSVLQQDTKVMKRYAEIIGGDISEDLKAVWTYQEPEGKEPGDPESP